MNTSKRTFLKGATALLAATALTPLGAMARDGDGSITAFITASFARESGESTAKDELVLSPEQSGKLQKLDGQKRADFLTDLILRWLKKHFPDVDWPIAGPDIGEELAHQTLAQLKENGLSEVGTPIPTKIKIKVKFKFKPPSDWEISLEINF